MERKKVKLKTAGKTEKSEEKECTGCTNIFRLIIAYNFIKCLLDMTTIFIDNFHIIVITFLYYNESSIVLSCFHHNVIRL
jgi:hypothetical protein